MISADFSVFYTLESLYHYIVNDYNLHKNRKKNGNKILLVIIDRI